MKKIILFMLLIANFACAKTINMLDWTPKFKYSSIEQYTSTEAREYCANKQNCHVECSRPSKCTINKTILNCPAFKTNTMDEYIATPSYMYRLIDYCFADESVHIRIEAHRVNYYFKHNKVEYVTKQFEKYDNKHGYIFKIHKSLTTDKDVKFKQN